MSGVTYSLMGNPHDKSISEKLFMATFIYSQSFYQKSAGSKKKEKFLSYFDLIEMSGHYNSLNYFLLEYIFLNIDLKIMFP